jgi:hypothetical protein
MSNLFRDTLPQVSKVGDEVLVPEPSKLWAVGQVVDSLRGPFSRRIKGNPPAQEILSKDILCFAILPLGHHRSVHHGRRLLVGYCEPFYYY